MSRRLFATFSKYRNSVGKPAKHEDAYTDIKPSTNASTDACQLIKVSQAWLAFKHASGGALGVLPVATVGRVGANVHVLQAHRSGVSDWDFSPFDPNQLVTGSDNGEVSVYQITGSDSAETPATSERVLTIQTGTGKAIEAIVHHPTARGIVATASGNVVQIWDTTTVEQGTTLSTPFCTLDHPNTVSSLSWKADGVFLATTCKDTQIRVFEPRKQNSPVQAGQGHLGNRPSRVVWVGDKNLLFTVGFNKMRERENSVWNPRNLDRPLEVKRMDSSSGIMVPLYDEDTSIMFIPSRGESIVRWIEIAESTPFMTEGTAFAAQGSVAGAALVPKQLMKVMQTEVARILTVTPNGVWPISVHVPRKSYLDFHADIYPDTKSTEPGLDASGWLQGQNKQVPRVSLDPGMAGKPAWARPTAQSTPPLPTPAPTPAQAPRKTQDTSVPTALPSTKAHLANDSKETFAANIEPASCTSPSSPTSPARTNAAASSPVSTTPPPFIAKTPSPAASPLAVKLASQKTSKFRFLTFKPYHASEHFESISGLSISTAPECNLIEVNPKFMALPLHGTGGRVGLLKTGEPGRVGNRIPSVVCSSDLLGFKFDPFNPHLLVTASDDTKIKGWVISEDGMDKESEDRTIPDWVLSSPTMDKISVILFHPSARDVLLSASTDRENPTLRLWDLKTKKEKVAMHGHKDVIFSCAFNHDGSRIVSVCKDKKIRIWDATSGSLVREGLGHDSLRSCRVLWLGESDLVASVGFGKGSQREILLYDSKDLKQGPIDKKLMDISPGVLVPHYDADTSILGISARGDRVMKHFEVVLGNKEDIETAGKSRFVDVAGLEQGTLQQDVAYLPKRYCQVKEIELAKMYRLTYNSVEVIRVSVPRNKKEYFQDDLFPDTADVEKAALEADEFFGGGVGQHRLQKISLCPSDMEPLSSHVVAIPVSGMAGGSSLDKFLQGKQQAAEDDRKRLAMEKMFETAKESKADRDTLVPDTGIIDDDEWDD